MALERFNNKNFYILKGNITIKNKIKEFQRLF